MGKAYSKGAKRRAKQAMPGLAATPRRKARGRARMDELPGEREDEAQSTVLTARARQMGLPASKALDMKHARLSEGAGMALDIIYDPEEATRLWGHYVAMTASEAKYHRSLGKSIHPKTAKIEMMQERFETRPDDAIDLRTEEERDRDAVTSWMRWQGIIGRLDARHQSSIFNAYRHQIEMVSGGYVTAAGRRFVDAMVRLDLLMQK